MVVSRTHRVIVGSATSTVIICRSGQSATASRVVYCLSVTKARTCGSIVSVSPQFQQASYNGVDDGRSPMAGLPNRCVMQVEKRSTISFISIGMSTTLLTWGTTSTARTFGAWRTASVYDSNYRAELRASCRLEGRLCSTRTRRSSSVIPSINCSFACVSCVVMGASLYANLDSLSTSSAISANGSPRCHLRFRSLTRFSSFCTPLPNRVSRAATMQRCVVLSSVCRYSA